MYATREEFRQRGGYVYQHWAPRLPKQGQQRAPGAGLRTGSRRRNAQLGARTAAAPLPCCHAKVTPLRGNTARMRNQPGLPACFPLPSRPSTCSPLCSMFPWLWTNRAAHTKQKITNVPRTTLGSGSESTLTFSTPASPVPRTQEVLSTHMNDYPLPTTQCFMAFPYKLQGPLRTIFLILTQTFNFLKWNGHTTKDTNQKSIHFRHEWIHLFNYPMRRQNIAEPQKTGSGPLSAGTEPKPLSSFLWAKVRFSCFWASRKWNDITTIFSEIRKTQQYTHRKSSGKACTHTMAWESSFREAILPKNCRPQRKAENLWVKKMYGF